MTFTLKYDNQINDDILLQDMIYTECCHFTLKYYINQIVIEWQHFTLNHKINQMVTFNFEK